MNISSRQNSRRSPLIGGLRVSPRASTQPKFTRQGTVRLDRSGGGCTQVAVHLSMDALRINPGGKGNENYVSIEIVAPETK